MTDPIHICLSCGTVIAYPPRTTTVRCPKCETEMRSVIRTQRVEVNPGEIGIVYILEARG